ncbi:MAG: DUF2341 domain-containing protein [PVC group bacterium]|nr:DUF2341 domain-containing protein [PVC group bacterium]
MSVVLCVGRVQAEVVSYISPLIWSVDDQGDFLLEASNAAGVYELPRGIEMDGQITSIIASWEFDGKVSLEVSADNGLTYTRAINGVPLVAGFKSGSMLRWKATLGPDSEMTQLSISYTKAEMLVHTFENPQLAGFSFRKQIKIINNSAEEVFNCQVPITIGETSSASDFDVHCNGVIAANFEDIRFACADQRTILSHYLEEVKGSSPDRQAVVWVKIPQVPVGELLLYVYYGNDKAEDVSDPEEVFDFYDEFKGFDLNPVKWQVKHGKYSVSKKGLRLDGAEIFTKVYQIQDGVIEYQAKADKGTEIRVIARGEKDSMLGSANQAAYSSNYTGAEHCLAVGDIVKANTATAIIANIVYDYRVQLKGAELSFQRYSEGFKELEAEAVCSDVKGLTSGNIGLTVSAGRRAYFSWIRVRKFLAEGVVVDESAAQAEAEAVKMPHFSRIQLNGKGNLVLEDGRSKGSYVSTTTVLAYEPRMFIPEYQTADSEKGDVQLGVSMDNGSFWTEDTQQNQMYFSKKKEMSADKLKFKLDFERVRGASPEVEEIKIEYTLGTITLIEPNGAEEWQAGTEETIFWSAQEYGTEHKMSLEYSINKGESYEAITKVAENTGQYIWSIPSDISSDQVFVRVSDAKDGNVFDVSDSVFSISGDGKEKQDKKDEEKNKEAVKDNTDKIDESGDLDVEDLMQAGERSGARSYDLLIKVGDNSHRDPKKDANAYKDGDIVVVKPTGHTWGASEKKEFLIVQVQLTESEAKTLTRPKQIPTGNFDENGKPIMRRVKRRAKKINLKKLGFSRWKKMKDVRKILDNKVVEKTAIENK